MTGIDYNDAALFLQQAINGEGVALTRRSLIGDDLRTGKLVKLFDVEITAENSYHLVCLPQYANSRKMRTFRDWMLKEIDWPQKYRAQIGVFISIGSRRLSPAARGN